LFEQDLAGKNLPPNVEKNKQPKKKGWPSRNEEKKQTSLQRKENPRVKSDLK